MELTQGQIFLKIGFAIFTEIFGATIRIALLVCNMITEAWAVTIPVIAGFTIAVWLLKRIKPPKAKAKTTTDPQDPQPPT